MNSRGRGCEFKGVLVNSMGSCDFKFEGIG